MPRGLVNNAAPRDGAAPALSALSLDGVELTPQFAAATVNYTATVAADVDEVTITATPAGDASVMLAPADADTALDTLTLTGATLAPAFTANVHDYAATVANTDDEVTVAATAAHTGTEHVTLDLTTASTDATVTVVPADNDPYSGTLNHPAPHVFAQAPLLRCAGSPRCTFAPLEAPRPPAPTQPPKRQRATTASKCPATRCGCLVNERQKAA